MPGDVSIGKCTVESVVSERGNAMFMSLTPCCCVSTPADISIGRAEKLLRQCLTSKEEMPMLLMSSDKVGITIGMH